MKGNGHQTYEVVIEFDSFGRDLIRGRRWHCSQELIELPGGGARPRMLLSGLEEIVRAVLSWGTHATVIRPLSPRERLVNIALDLTGKYETPIEA